MEESATQPATQPFLDPRRQGYSSNLKEEDETDILCILTPSSRAAFNAVDLIASTSPQHVLQNQTATSAQIDELPIAQKETNHGQDSGDEYDQMETDPNGLTGSDSLMSRDIALRMSSQLKDPCRGFVFGRSLEKCDLVVSDESTMKLSSCHFRIFVNRHGVLMLEDTSRNGTFVDRTLLRSTRGNPENDPSVHCRRTLSNGVVIELPTITRRVEDTIRFIVRFPSRDTHLEQYNQRLTSYLSYLQKAERQMQMIAADRGQMPPPTLLPFSAHKTEDDLGPNASILSATTGDHNRGLSWNGGEKYNIVSQIGKGAFALVYKLSAKHNGEVYACKQIEKRKFIKDGVLNHKVHNEILVMKDLDHPNIVNFVEYYETKVHIYIVMEYISMGDLSQYTEKDTAMPEFMCQAMAAQILSALDYLHHRRITHRDIKPDNILVASHQPFLFKLSDFGLSKIINNDETFLKSFCGTLLYCAPEIYPGFQRAKMGLHPTKRTRPSEPRKGTLPYEHSVDVWSTSAVLFHLLSGKAPYTGSMEDEGTPMLLNIINTLPNWGRLEGYGTSPNGVDFVKRGLVIEPADRATERELLAHSWLSGEPVTIIDDPNSLGRSKTSEELDASQLSITDQKDSLDNIREIDELEDPRESKRSRHLQPDESVSPVDLFADQRRERSLQGPAATPFGSSVEGDRSFIPRPPRLFGEINSSVLKSSGVLGGHVPQSTSNGGYGSDESFADADSMLHAEGNALNQASNAASGQEEHRQAKHGLNGNGLVTQNGVANGPAPSLFGAEALVGQMHMSNGQSITKQGEDTESSRVLAQKVVAQDQLAAKSNIPLPIMPRIPTGEILGSTNLYQESTNAQATAEITLTGPLPLGRPERTSLSSMKSRPCFGKLVPVEGSVSTIPIDITAQAITYGRDPLSDYVHPDKSEDRVPKNALDIAMWYPNMERDVANGKVDWHLNEDLAAIISTRTTRSIKINGVRLSQGKGCWLYGRLKTGDIITIFEPPDGLDTASATSRQKQYLRFRCEFYIGASREPRRADEHFQVKTEEEKYRKYEVRRSRESSTANSPQRLSLDYEQAG